MKKITLNSFWVLLALAMLYSCGKSSSPADEIKPIPPVEESVLNYPKKEMRAVWLTTAWGLDWPMGDYTVSGQKQKYIAYLDKFKALNINSIFFQVRSFGDSYYNSPYEPWASSITGTRGLDPGYDVLQFLIAESHARGIEFHAWMNPYRIATRSGSSVSYPALHSTVPASWVLSHEKIQIYNPAVPEVRQRLSAIVKDLLTKYDVDGIHFDDYFYPDPSSAGVMVSDESDYSIYGAGYSNIQNFRRGNVDLAIEDVYKTIVATKPAVVFSISPAANKDYNYNTLYADVAKWCQSGWVDLLIPQLYQQIGNSSNPFEGNLAVWSQFNYKAALMIGHGFYKFGDPTQGSSFQTTNELQNQFNLTQRHSKVIGNAQYSAKYILENKIGITDKLAEIYKDQAVMPFIGRTVSAAAAAVNNVRIESGVLKWTSSGQVRSVVYYFEDLKAIGRVLSISEANSLPIEKPGYYTVSSLNSDNQESKASDAVKL